MLFLINTKLLIYIMKTVLSHEYKFKKLIADRLQKLVNKRYIEISDEEYARVNNAVNSYGTSVSESYDQLQNIGFTEQQQSSILSDIANLKTGVQGLEAGVQGLKISTLYTQEDGLYFTDENGNIGAKLDANGFQAININAVNNGGGSQGVQGVPGAQGAPGVQGVNGAAGQQGVNNLTIIDY